jgi:hypothetical protein
MVATAQDDLFTGLVGRLAVHAKRKNDPLIYYNVPDKIWLKQYRKKWVSNLECGLLT